MKETTFNLVVNVLQQGCERRGKLAALGVETGDITDGYINTITALMAETYSADKIDTLQWYLYEYRKGKMIISSSKTGETLYDFDVKGDLWKYMCE